MNTTTQPTTFKNDLLENTANMLKAAGMKIFYSVWKHEKGRKLTYFHFVQDDKIGYCQEGYFGGIRFSTVHKPSREAGTGFGLQDDPGLYEPTVKDAEKAFILIPSWFSRHKFTPIKYKNWDEYKAKNNSCEYVEF